MANQPPPGGNYQPPYQGQYPGGQQYPGPGYPQSPGYPPPGGYQYGGPLLPPPGKLRPGRAWYLLPLALVLGGVAWVVLAFGAFHNQVNSMPRVPLPQGGQVSLPHSGGYVIYYEGPAADSGRFGFFNVRISPASPGAVVGGLHGYSATVTYTVGSHTGRAVLSLQVTRPGSFHVAIAGSPPSGSDLAFGQSLAGSIVRIVLPTILLIGGGIALGLVLLIVRIVRRSNQRALLARGVPG